ncbi:uncharacterized protein L3040_005430 [Drepanopeziza brunnea f. sp. 'multigermtubi']|uniref:Mediator of RNA polymerase II transcription subunit 7 n=1 Tax=Marssonina brunnea f. sp. multigermtubi (strain MB_m1) TaxID=1072389 RepID=K1XN85_MARBU|nr:mediator complex subunit 7 [Drepanopeziza brunnea f. sp. 'multigermtubi' MB_m1]EKD13959.1 mediator complex subunit 7 [Drepanopeziza brunnea f. sp. 'multigermtubi' MB_m1]KAJ5040871.1 hypothetical protein L3040_005430 [Drepanopeziza brunnea f. sp. 'multigermtubi']
MDEPQQPSSLATAFPSPPPFWTSFTPSNIEQIASLRAAALSSAQAKASDASPKLPLRLLDLPAELRNLQPPEPPADGHYRCFGDQFWLDAPLPTLQELSIDQLYTPPASPSPSSSSITKPHHDRAFTLKRLAKSLLLNFLELVGIMAINPEHYVEKVDDLKTLFVNFHHLLNEYRPHQARESLILMMREQLERSRAETRGIREMKERVEGVLEGLAAKGVENLAVDVQMEEPVADRGREVWEELERQFGGVVT